MIRLVAAFSPRSDTLQRVEGALRVHGTPATLGERGFAAAWAPGAAVESARANGVASLLAGAPGGSTGAAELASAYGAGELDLTPLRGAFAVLLWDAARGRGIIAADQLGVLSPVFRRTGGETLLAVETADLLGLLPTRPAPDEPLVAQWLASGSLPPGATLFAGLERLPGGHLLELERGSVTRRRYFRFEHERPLDGRRDELEHELRSALQQAVRRRLPDDASAGVLLSGGLDSAAVAATATRLCGRSRLRSYSLVFPQHPDVDERPLIEVVADELGLASVLVPYRPEGLLAAGLSYVRRWHLPPVSPTLAVQLPLLRRAAQEGATTLVDGQGGDELFGAPLYLLADRLRRLRPRQAAALARRIADIPERHRARATRRALYEFGLKGALPYRLHPLARRLRARTGSAGPGWLTARAAELHEEASDPWRWKRQAGPRWWAELLDSVTEQRERSGAHEYLRHRNAHAGVRGGHPLLQDLDLIRLVLRLPPELAFDPVLDRPLLRSALSGLVPDHVRLRREKSYFTSILVEAMDVHDAAAVRRLLTAGDAAINEYARPRLLLDAPRGHRGEAWAWSLWRLAMLECWLRGEGG